MRSIVTWFCLLFLFISTVCSAEIYQWRDEKGKLHFSDTPPEHAQTEKLELGPINSADEVKVDQTRKQIEANERLINSEAKPTEDEKRKKQQELATICKKLGDEYIDLKWGKSATAKHTVLTDDSGKVISRREQNELAEKFRRNANARGCNIKFKEW